MKILLPVCLFLSSFCLGQSSLDEVLALHQKKFDWLETKQVDSLSKLMSDDMLYIHSNGWIESKADLLENQRTGKLNYKKITVENASPRQYDKTVIVQGIGRFEAEMDGNAFDIKLNYTEVYAYQDGKWKLVSRHACKL